jgi:hypothetical protein
MEELSFSAAELPLVVTPSAQTFASLIKSHRGPEHFKHYVYMTSRKVGQRSSRASVRDLRHPDSGRGLE